MKKIDVVEIKEYSYPQKNNLKVKKLSNKELYKEKTSILYSKNVIDENISVSELLSKLAKEFEKQRKVMEKTNHKFSFLKLFSYSAKKSNTFNELLLNLDNYFSRLNKEYASLVKRCKELQNYQVDNKDIYLDVYYKIIELNIFIEGLNDDLKYIEKNYYPEMKVTVFNLCDGKTSKELDELNDNINNYLKEFKSMQEAFDYICYNSGPLITDTVNSFVESLQKNGRNVSSQYFLDSDVVIAFNYVEWINLMKRLYFVKNKFKNDDYSINFLENFKTLEICYSIILIFNSAVDNNER